MPREPTKRPGDEEPPFTTEAAEGSLRRGRAARRDEVAARLRAAALAVTGEQGYQALSVQKILDRSGVGRSTFYAHFAGKEECFFAAYEEAIGELEEIVLAACREEPDWLVGFAAALAALARLLVERPTWAAAVIEEPSVAGGAAGAKRQEVLERLSHTIDTARRDPKSRHSPPPTAAPFILAGIESAAVRSLRGTGPDFAGVVPDLIVLAAIPYFGEKAAWRARRARGD